MSHPDHSHHSGGSSVHNQAGQLVRYSSQPAAHRSSQRPNAHGNSQPDPQASRHSPQVPSSLGYIRASQLDPHIPDRGSRRVHFADANSSSVHPPGSPPGGLPIHPNSAPPPYESGLFGQAGGNNFFGNPPPGGPPISPPGQPAIVLPGQPPAGPPPPPAYPYYYQGGGGGGGFYYVAAARAAPPRRPAARWQDRPVEVVLSNELVFHCNRADITYHLPGTRQDPFGRRLYPASYLAPANRTPIAEEGLRHLFRSLELYRLQSQPVRLFDRAADLLDRADDARKAYSEACRLFCGLCAALDKEWGLGCSDELLLQFDEFVVVLMQGYDPACDRPRVLVDLLNSYSQVFHPGDARHVQALRRAWRALPLYARSGMAASLWGRTATAPRTSSRAAFVRMLRDMCSDI
ncbi:hypothetical protein PG991_003161 [Apiospora marii]|uniref:Uncharacterized protein n=1 Tax=Apiospora marii TaxID=335849 RepID=A0ABR1SHF6_9PEZI